MEEMERQTSGGHRPQFVSEENKEGLLGTLGVKQRYDGQPDVGPECGPSQLYAVVEAD
jgi:hypothetical protein